MAQPIDSVPPLEVAGEVGDRRNLLAEAGDGDSERDDDHQREAHGAAELDPEPAVVAIGGEAREHRDDGGGQRDGDDAVRHLADQEAEAVDVRHRRRPCRRRRRRGWRRLPSRMTTMYAIWLTRMNSSVQTPSRSVWPRPTPRKSNRGRKWKPACRRYGTSTSGLQGDGGRRPEPEQQRLRSCVKPVGAVGLCRRRTAYTTSTPHGDHVVDDRRPHHRAEALAGVEHLADQHERAVEEHLRHAQQHQQPRRVALWPLAGENSSPSKNDVQQQGHGDHQQRGGAGEHQQTERDDAVGVRVAAVRVVLHRCARAAARGRR